MNFKTPQDDIEFTVQELEKIVLTRLSGQIDLPDIIFVAELCISTLEMLSERYAHMEPTQKLACRDGCSNCCTTMGVVVRPIFAILALIAFRQKHNDDEYEAMTHRLFENPIHCAMLKDNSCSVYEKRPLNCRAFYSFDYSLCVAGVYNESNSSTIGLDHKYRVRHNATSLINSMLERVEKKLGLETDKVYLHEAFAILLTHPDAIQRWAQGEKIFATKQN